MVTYQIKVEKSTTFNNQLLKAKVSDFSIVADLGFFTFTRHWCKSLAMVVYGLLNEGVSTQRGKPFRF